MLFRSKVDKLVYPSFISWNPIYRVSDLIENAGNYYTSKPYEMYQALKARVIDEIDVSRKVFIYRKDTIRNDLINEDEIAKLFAEYGFEIVVPTSMNIVDQIRLFAGVKVLAGAEGAAFTNMVYMSKKTTVICITPRHKHKYMVSSLANTLGINCVYLDAKPTQGKQHYLNIDYLKRFLNGFEL